MAITFVSFGDLDDLDDYEESRLHEKDKQEQYEEDEFDAENDSKPGGIIILDFVTGPLMKTWVLLGINNILNNVAKKIVRFQGGSRTIDLNKLVVYQVFRLILRYYRSLRYWSFPDANVHKSIFDFRNITPSAIEEALIEIANNKDFIIKKTNLAVENLFEQIPTEGMAFVVNEKPEDFDVFSSGVLCFLTDENGIPLDFQVIFKNRPTFDQIDETLKSLQAKYNLKNMAVVVEKGLDKLFKEKGIKPKNLPFTVYRSEFLPKYLEELMRTNNQMGKESESKVTESQPTKPAGRTKNRTESIVQKPGTDTWIHSYPTGKSLSYYQRIEEIMDPLKKMSISFKDIYEMVWDSGRDKNTDLMTIGEVLIQFLSLLTIGTIRKLLSQRNINLNNRQLVELLHTVNMYAIRYEGRSQIIYSQRKVPAKTINNQQVSRYPMEQWKLYAEILELLGIPLHDGMTTEDLFLYVGSSYPLTPRITARGPDVAELYAARSKKKSKKK